jgi:hypothetical protein
VCRRSGLRLWLNILLHIISFHDRRKEGATERLIEMSDGISGILPEEESDSLRMQVERIFDGNPIALR